MDLAIEFLVSILLVVILYHCFIMGICSIALHSAN